MTTDNDEFRDRLERAAVLATSRRYDYEAVPQHLRDGLEDYILHRRLPGAFLTAVLENNLKGSVFRADSTSLEMLPILVYWLQMRAPSTCWGSADKVDAWLQDDGEVRWTIDWTNDGGS